MVIPQAGLNKFKEEFNMGMKWDTRKSKAKTDLQKTKEQLLATQTALTSLTEMVATISASISASTSNTTTNS